MKNPRKKQAHLIHVRLSDAMLRMVNETVTKDLHVSVSEFIRDAIIEYVKNNYPTRFAHYKGESLIYNPPKEAEKK